MEQVRIERDDGAALVLRTRVHGPFVLVALSLLLGFLGLALLGMVLGSLFRLGSFCGAAVSGVVLVGVVLLSIAELTGSSRIDVSNGRLRWVIGNALYKRTFDVRTDEVAAIFWHVARAHRAYSERGYVQLRTGEQLPLVVFAGPPRIGAAVAKALAPRLPSCDCSFPRESPQP